MPTTSDLPAYAGLALLAVAIGVTLFREMSKRLEIPKPAGLSEEMLVGIMRREYGAMVTESYSHLMAPALNSITRTVELQHELMRESRDQQADVLDILREFRNQQTEILKILSVVADRIPRE